MLFWGARGTLRKYLPLPVERKYSPFRLSACTPMGTHSPGTSLKYGRHCATSSGLMR